MRSAKRRVSRSTMVLLALLSLAVAGMVVPQRWTGGLISLVQVLVPFQAAVNNAADAVSESLSEDQEPVSVEAFDAAIRQKNAYEHQVASLSVRVASLEEEVSVLAATRLWGDAEDRIGSRGRLIPARVVTGDLLAWHSSRLINAGSLQGVRTDAAVTTRFFSIDRGTSEGVQRGMAILRSEALLGIVREVGTHTARVRLLSDVGIERKVRIARRTDEGFEAAEGFFWLVGRGGGSMEIRDVIQRDVEAGAIAVGDLVLSNHTDPMLPASLVIGTIAAIEADRDNPLLSILTVRSAVDERALRRVYVFDPGPKDTE